MTDERKHLEETYQELKRLAVDSGVTFIVVQVGPTPDQSRFLPFRDVFIVDYTEMLGVNKHER